MNILDKFGSIGTVAGGFGMSCCLPLFATISSAVGLGFLARYGSQLNYLMQAAAVLAVAGTLWAYRRHKNALPVILSVLGAALILYSVNTDMNANVIYGGMIGLIAAAVLNSVFARRCGNCETSGEARCS